MNSRGNPNVVMKDPQTYTEATLPTRHGNLRIRVYQSPDGTEPVAILGNPPFPAGGVPVRIHSACFTSETLGSLKCDCREQLEFALDHIARHGGVVIYLHQEGRGIGLTGKVQAYALQDLGYDTIEANHMLGFPADARTYESAVRILHDLEIESVRLITNNPEKIAALEDAGITVVDRIPVVIPPTEHSERYLNIKFNLMGHIPEPVPEPGPLPA